MKVFQLFKKDLGGSGHTAHNKKSDRSRKKKLQKSSSVASFSMDNAAFVDQWVDTLNSHHISKLEALLSPTSRHTFVGVEMTNKDFREQMAGLFASFPDVHFQLVAGSVKRLKDDATRAKYVAKGSIFVTGTHTGEPFGFGPYPPVEATGRKVRNDRETLTITYDPIAQNIVHIDVVPEGPKTGPHSIYEQVGGFPTM